MEKNKYIFLQLTPTDKGIIVFFFLFFTSALLLIFSVLSHKNYSGYKSSHWGV